MFCRILSGLAIALAVLATSAKAEPPNFYAVKRTAYQNSMPRRVAAHTPPQPVPAQTMPTPAEESGVVYDPDQGGSYLQDSFGGCCDSCCGDYCGMGACCSQPCGVWGGIDALSWWVRGSQAPPLVSTDALPDGTVLFPTNDLDQQARFGGRVTLGTWLTPCQEDGFFGNFFILGTADTNYTATAVSGGPTIGRPFTNYADPTTPTPDFLNLITAGVASGTINVHTTSNLMG